MGTDCDDNYFSINPLVEDVDNGIDKLRWVDETTPVGMNDYDRDGDGYILERDCGSQPIDENSTCDDDCSATCYDIY